jgi:hypothetical protein
MLGFFVFFVFFFPGLGGQILSAGDRVAGGSLCLRLTSLQERTFLISRHTHKHTHTLFIVSIGVYWMLHDILQVPQEDRFFKRF